MGRTYDVLGLGWARGDPHDKAKPSEQVFELFWRFQVHRFLSITPDLVWVVDPIDNPDEEEILVFGLRFLLSL